LVIPVLDAVVACGTAGAHHLELRVGDLRHSRVSIDHDPHRVRHLRRKAVNLECAEEANSAAGDALADFGDRI
jgi:hypothetical protein